jgi:hypothetical protein
MSYIGNQPTSVAFVTDQFNGDGTTTIFTMSVAPANTASALVVVSGVVQDPSTYSVSGTTLTFSAAPPTGTGNISVRYLGIPASNITTTAYRTITEFTATASQTTFTPASYTPGFINVYRNGVLLGTADYTATNGTTVVLAVGATAGDLVSTESFYVSSVLNAIPAVGSAVIGSYIADGAIGTAKIADDAVTTAKIAAGAVIPADLSTGAPSWDSSGVLSFNSGYGSTAVAYACRSWVSFNGTGTVAIRGSGNVSSITDNGTGLYTVNFTTAMPDANYGWTGSVKDDGASAPFLSTAASVSTPIYSTTQLKVQSWTYAGSPYDSSAVTVTIFR